MNIDFREASGSTRYRVLTQTVAPRPVAWVLSDSGEGGLNLAPFSYFNVVSSDPALLMISVGLHGQERPKDTRRNIGERKHFVVHIAHDALLPPLNQSAKSLAHGESELDLVGVATTDFAGFSLPRIQGCRVAFGCQLHQRLIPKGASSELLFGRVERVYLDDELVEETEDGKIRVDTAALGPIARLGGADYSSLGTIHSIPRP